MFLAGAITFSSTIIIMKLLMEKKDHETVYGRHMIGLMIVQDIIAIAMIVGIGLMETNSGVSASFTLFVLKVGILFTAVFMFSRYFLPGLLQL